VKTGSIALQKFFFFFSSFAEKSLLSGVKIFFSRFVSKNKWGTLPRVQDYLDSETRYRNDVIVSLRFG